MSSETGKALGLISIYTGLMFFLIGMAARYKSDFHYRAEISAFGLCTAGALALLGFILILFSFRKTKS